MADYHWYPGHMTRARRMMQENLSLVDLVIEIIDARVPLSSRNPDIDALAGGKERILVMGKNDLADPKASADFSRIFEQQGFTVLSIDSRQKKSAKQVKDAILLACRQKMEKDRKRGIKGRPVRAMVCGIPNVGKSTLINSLSGRSSAKTENRPGVTRGRQWIAIRASENRKPQGRYAPGNPAGVTAPALELMDTPGILWPKFDDRTVGIKLALVGAIREEVVDEEELSLLLLGFLAARHPEALTDKYGISTETLHSVTCRGDFAEEGNFASLNELRKELAVKRSFLLKGGEPDLARCSRVLLDDFRDGRCGRITLDEVPSD